MNGNEHNSRPAEDGEGQSSAPLSAPADGGHEQMPDLSDSLAPASAPDTEENPLPLVVLGPIDVPESPAEETPRPRPLPYRRPISFDNPPTSRELLLGWCLWLLGSWLILGMGTRGTPVREMIFASLFGMMFLWPAFRLSQDGARRVRSSPAFDESGSLTGAAAVTRSAFSNLTPPLIFRDWFALNMVFQAVIWPHVLTGLWHLDQAAWVSAAVGAWTLLAGSIIALGCLSLRRSHRVAAMAAVMLLVFGEPLVLAWINRLGESNPQGGYDWAMHVSPIEAVYALSSRAIDFDPSPWTFPLACVALAGVMTWTVLLSVRRR